MKLAHTAVTDVIDLHMHVVQAASEAERPALQSHLQPLLGITTTHLDGTAAYARQVGTELFSAFLEVEELFQRGSDATEQEIIDELRQVKTATNITSIMVSVNEGTKSGLPCKKRSAYNCQQEACFAMASSLAHNTCYTLGTACPWYAVIVVCQSMLAHIRCLPGCIYILCIYI